MIDHARHVISIEYSDGSVVLEPQRRHAPPCALEITRTEFDVAARILTLTLPSGPRVTVEVGAGGGLDAPPLGRPVVYLDQNHWITLAQRIYAPARVTSPQVAAAADRLIEHAQAARIILPLSSAHLQETGRTDGRQRADLATTMLGLSRGWQMRSPLAVRHRELVQSMTGTITPSADAFTLAPDVLFATSVDREQGHGARHSHSVPDPERLPFGLADLTERLAWISAVYDVMIEDEKEDPPAGREQATAWAQHHKDLGLSFRATRKPKEHIRLAAWAAVLADTGDDIARAAARAGMTIATHEEWLDEAETHIASLPYLGRLNEITWSRLSNADERWEANDLNDMHYLACAAGYADVVAAENATAHHLVRATKRVPAGAAVYAKLPQAVAEVDRLLA